MSNYVKSKNINMRCFDYNFLNNRFAHTSSYYNTEKDEKFYIPLSISKYTNLNQTKGDFSLYSSGPAITHELLKTFPIDRASFFIRNNYMSDARIDFFYNKANILSALKKIGNTMHLDNIIIVYRNEFNSFSYKVLHKTTGFELLYDEDGKLITRDHFRHTPNYVYTNYIIKKDIDDLLRILYNHILIYNKIDSDYGTHAPDLNFPMFEYITNQLGYFSIIAYELTDELVIIKYLEMYYKKITSLWFSQLVSPEELVIAEKTKELIDIIAKVETGKEHLYNQLLKNSKIFNYVVGQTEHTIERNAPLFEVLCKYLSDPVNIQDNKNSLNKNIVEKRSPNGAKNFKILKEICKKSGVF